MSNEDNKKARGCITGSITGGGGSGGAGHDQRNWGDVVVDGKHYSPEMVKALLTERDSLAATVEVLRNAISPEVIELIRCGIGGNYVGSGFYEAMDKFHAPLVKALTATPQQHLRDMRADAGRDGFIAGSEQTAQFITGQIDYVIPLLDARADQYADSVRRGEK